MAGPRVAKEPAGGGGGGWADAGPEAWACEERGSRPGMGSGGDAGGRGLSGAQARRPGPRRPQRGSGAAEQPSGLSDAGRGSPAASAARRARAAAPRLRSLPSPFVPPAARPPASPSGPESRPAGGSRALRPAPGARAGPRAPAPPPPSAAEAAQGRPAGATARGASAARPSGPRPRPPRPRPRPGPRPPAARFDLRSCGQDASWALRAASGRAGCAVPAGGAGHRRRAGPPLPAALGLDGGARRVIYCYPRLRSTGWTKGRCQW